MKKIRLIAMLMGFLLCYVRCSEDLASPEATNSLFGDASTTLVAQIGNLPASLRSQLQTSENLKSVSTADFDHRLSPKTAMLVINADAVDPAHTDSLVTGEMLASALEQHIPVVIGADTDLGQKNELTMRIANVRFEKADLTMVQTENDDKTLVTPIGGIAPNNMKEEELVWMLKSYLGQEEPEIADEPDEPVTNSIGVTNNTAGSGCFYWNKKPTKKVQGWDLRSDIKKPETHWSPYIYTRVPKGSFAIGEQDLITYMRAGQGQTTFREAVVTTKSRTKKKSWNWKVKFTYETLGTIGASGWYGQTRESSTTFSDSYSSGQTVYTEPCVYACCDTRIWYQAKVNIWHSYLQLTGSSILTYGARLGSGSNEIGLRRKYCYGKSKSNPLKFEHDGISGNVYTQLVFKKVNPACSNKTCTAAKKIKTGANKGKRPCEIGSIGK